VEFDLSVYTPIIVNVFLTVITAVIGAVGLAVRSFVNSKLNAEQLANLNTVATIAVQAAEQLYGAFEGDQKKQFALDYAEAELAKRGIKVETDQLSAIIEAAVLAEFNYPAAVEPAPAPAETVVSQSADSEGQVVTSTPVTEDSV
jgi:LL-H family phage holin